jgi:hypothetical protein
MAPSVSSHYNFQLLPLACVWHKMLKKKKLVMLFNERCLGMGRFNANFSYCSLFEAGRENLHHIIVQHNIHDETLASLMFFFFKILLLCKER